MKTHPLRPVLFGALILLVAACAQRVHRRLVEPPDAPAAGTSRYLKAHLLDGGLLVFDTWAVDDTARVVRGRAVGYDVQRNPAPAEECAVAIDSVAVFETDELRPSGAIGAMTVVTAASLAGTVACLMNPKACFGSCPTFYVTGGGKPTLMAEGFSASIAPSLEAWDLDALYRAKPRGRVVLVTMTNEALETHAVRHADLLAAPRAEGTRVFATPDRVFRTAFRIRAPRSATGPEGDCRGLLAAFDGDERQSLADSLDLAAREELVLTFDPPAEGDVGLVLATRQSLLTTFLLYQTFAWMGNSAGEWMARLERGDPAVRSRVTGMAERLGRIDVEIRRDGTWRPVRGVREPGPLATDVVLIPLPELPPGNVAVRLRMARGMHRLDWAALAELGPALTPLRIAPASVRRADAPDVELRHLLVDPDSLLVTFPGDTCRLVYELPADAVEYELFMDSRGYYLEWMREAWLAEEDPVALAKLFLDPASTLRDLAPAFKAREPEMEESFWRSRYAKP